MTSVPEGQTAAPVAANDLRGGLYMIATALTYAASFALVKDVTATTPQSMILFVRSAVALLCFAPLLIRHGPGFLKTDKPFGHFTRSVVGFSGYFCFVMALSMLPLGDAVAYSFTLPLWALVLGVVVFGDKLTWRLLAAVGVSAVGVILIAGPSGQFGWGMVFALGNAVFSAFTLMLVKRLTTTEPPDRISFYFILFGTCIAGCLAIFDWKTPNMREFLELAASGVTFYGSLQFMTRGYKYGTFSRMAPFDFLRLPLSVAVGIIWFAETPGLIAMFGMVLIVGAAATIMLDARRGR